MGNIQSIQNALIAINETVFQDLCDSFLVSINRDYTAFSRTGSQVGKQKTKKGTPDSCFWQKNGKFVFVEYSTNVTSGVSKLISDVEKLDAIKNVLSGVDPSQTWGLLILMVVVPYSMMIISNALYQKKYTLDEAEYERICKELEARK